MPDRHIAAELLAPAGGHDALVAAVNNGADAVYLGLPQLNARRGAANFDLETLAEGARFAHLRQAKVYLTANVVVLPEELRAALSMIEEAWAAGVDAVIVQDLGLLRALQQSLPDVRVHASTQIDAMNPDAVNALAEAGAARVTLARELTLEGIAACAATGVEVETFVHGALCYSYSGQCLMSSLIGRRSANRGLCAQPCRLTYELVGPKGAPVEVPGRYLLSAKDTAGIEHLPALLSAGVAALKIEGRMKSAEYVAIVTSVYRAALDRALADPEGFGVKQAEWEMLEEAFSRGFTDGYLTDRRGGDLMSYTRPNNRGVFLGRVISSGGARANVQLERALDSGDTLEVWTRDGRFAQGAGALIVAGAAAAAAPAGAAIGISFERSVTPGDRVFRVANATLLQAARRTFTGSSALGYAAPVVDFAVHARIGQRLLITATARGVTELAEGEEVTAARTRPITPEDIIEHVGRVGGSGYRAGSWQVDLDAGAGLGFSALHSLRRTVLKRLDEALLAPWASRPRAGAAPLELPEPAPRAREPLLIATAWDSDTAAACLSAGADRVFVRVFANMGDDYALPAGVHPLLPRVVWSAETRELDRWLEAGASVGNLGSVHRAGTGVEADWPLNVLNAHAAAMLADMGSGLVWASPELSGRQLAVLAGEAPVPVGFVIWGRIELMVSEQCVLQASGPCGRQCRSCARRSGWWRLRDRKGYEFPVTTDPSGRSHILNSVTLDLTRALDEIVAAGVSAVRLDFSDEGPIRAGQVTSAVRSGLIRVLSGGGPPERPVTEPATSGNFYRGLL